MKYKDIIKKKKPISITDIVELCPMQKALENCPTKINISCGYILSCDNKIYCKAPIVFNPDKTKLYERYLNQ